MTAIPFCSTKSTLVKGNTTTTSLLTNVNNVPDAQYNISTAIVLVLLAELLLLLIFTEVGIIQELLPEMELIHVDEKTNIKIS